MISNNDITGWKWYGGYSESYGNEDSDWLYFSGDGNSVTVIETPVVATSTSCLTSGDIHIDNYEPCRCPYCGVRAVPGDRYCDGCGAPV